MLHMHSRAMAQHWMLHMHSRAMAQHWMLHVHSRAMAQHWMLHVHSRAMAQYWMLHMHSRAMAQHCICVGDTCARITNLKRNYRCSMKMHLLTRTKQTFYFCLDYFQILYILLRWYTRPQTESHNVALVLKPVVLEFAYAVALLAYVHIPCMHPHWSMHIWPGLVLVYVTYLCSCNNHMYRHIVVFTFLFCFMWKRFFWCFSFISGINMRFFTRMNEILSPL